MYKTLILMTVVAMMSACAAQETFTVVSLDETQVAVAQGSPFVLNSEIRNAGSGQQPLLFTKNGTLDGLRLIVTNAKGEQLVPRNSPWDSRSVPPPSDRIASLDSGQSIRLSFDLAAIYNMSAPGDYSLSIPHEGGKPIERRWSVFALREVNDRTLTASCLDWPYRVGGSSLVEGARTISCRLVLCEGIGTTPPQRFIAIRDVVTGYESRDRLSDPLTVAVSDAAQVVSSVLDIEWNVWALVRSGSRSALIRWDLARSRVETIVDWTEQKLVLTSTVHHIKKDAYLAIGGMATGPLFSTTAVRNR